MRRANEIETGSLCDRGTKYTSKKNQVTFYRRLNFKAGAASIGSAKNIDRDRTLIKGCKTFVKTIDFHEENLHNHTCILSLIFTLDLQHGQR